MHEYSDVQSPRRELTPTKLRQVVELVIKELETLADSEPSPDVVVVVMPPVVERECAAVGLEMRKTKHTLTPAEKVERAFKSSVKKWVRSTLPSILAIRQFRTNAAIGTFITL